MKTQESYSDIFTPSMIKSALITLVSMIACLLLVIAVSLVN